MAYTAPTVNYSATLNGTYTTLTGVQSVSVFRGRRFFQDNFSASTCTVELIPADSYPTPLAIGQFIDVRDANSSTSPAYFTGRIVDIQRTYQIPYNAVSGAAPADRITITCSGSVGVVASNVIANSTYSNDLALVNANLIMEDSGLKWVSPSYGTVNSGSITLENVGALDAINSLLRTAQTYIDDYDMKRSPSGGFNFSAIVNPTPGLFVFEQGNSLAGFNHIEFLSSAQNVFNKVNVDAPGFATQTTSGTAPFNTLVYNTYNQTATDALSLSNYLYVLYSQSLTPVPCVLGVDTNVLDGCMAFTQLSPTAVVLIGSQVSVTLRGVTTDAIAQGFEAHFYPDHGSINIFLSPAFGTPFTLDSASFGVLDTNRLGYP